MLINKILDWIVQLIMGTFEKMLYVTKSNKQKQELNAKKENADEAQKQSDDAVSDFRIKLRQYRKSRKLSLRRDLDKLRASGGKAATDNSTKKQADSGSGKAAEDGAGRG